MEGEVLLTIPLCMMKLQNFCLHLMAMHIGETIAPLYPELSIQLFLADLFFSTLFYTYLDLSRKYELV